MKGFVAILVSLLVAMPAAAQRQERDWKGKHQGMSKDERQRMREDMRDVYRDRERPDRQQQRQSLSPQEREKLRRDIEDANRGLRR